MFYDKIMLQRIFNQNLKYFNIATFEAQKFSALSLETLQEGDNLCTENALKLTEKYFLDLRNMFSNQENLRIFFSKQAK